MSGTAAFRAKKALIDALDGQPGLEGVNLAYAWPGRDAPRECVYGARTEWTTELKTFAPAGGRNMRQEDGTFDLYVEVSQPGGSQAEAEERAVEIGTVVEEFLAGNPTIDGVTDLKLGQVLGGDLDSIAEDDGSLAALHYRIGFRSLLD